MDIQMKHDCMIVKINYEWHKLIDINDSFKKWAKWSGRKNKLPNFNANPKKVWNKRLSKNNKEQSFTDNAKKLKYLIKEIIQKSDLRIYILMERKVF